MQKELDLKIHPLPMENHLRRYGVNVLHGSDQAVQMRALSNLWADMSKADDRRTIKLVLCCLYVLCQGDSRLQGLPKGVSKSDKS